MLIQLTLLNYTVVEHLEIDFKIGFTSITGETGVGKSTIFDALALVLGAKTNTAIIKHEKNKCEISAIFDISKLTHIQQWLIAKSLDSLDTTDECILRRVINTEGRSYCYINDKSVTLSILKELGAQLVNIHSQHAHQELLNKNTHLKILDQYADYGCLLLKVKQIAKQYHKQKTALNKLQEAAKENEARIQLLQYQLVELEELNLRAQEVELLEERFKSLSNKEHILTTSQMVLDKIWGDNAMFALISKVQNTLDKLDIQEISQINKLFESAKINIEEAAHSLQEYISLLNVSSSEKQELELRLDKIYTLSRKHHTKATDLYYVINSIKNQLQEFTNDDKNIETLQTHMYDLALHYMQSANLLTEKRAQTATNLSVLVEAQMSNLNMEGTFTINLKSLANTDNNINETGLETAEFLVSTHPSQPVKPLVKVASGGELSRISLALEILTANANTTGILVFDEVDVGIGGKTALAVGNMLQTLGKQVQVLCVTHLAQVAAHAHNHIKFDSVKNKNNTHINVNYITGKERITEIARMLSGSNDKSALEHAEKLIQQST